LGVTEKDNDAVLTLLTSYYEKNVPVESDSLHFTLPGELRSLDFVCPPGDEDKQLAEWGLLTLFGLLSLDNILIIYRAILLEKQVIVVSKDLGILSAVVLSLLPIFRPYVFQGPFIAILPRQLYECLEAPVPYIYGIPSMPTDDPEMVKRLNEDKIIVYADDNQIHLPFKLPFLPKQEKLYPFETLL
jgi:hypothetical protein